MTDSSHCRSRGKVPQLKKSRTDFPLSVHRGTGYWRKKVRGRVHYFGKVVDDSKGIAAEEAWARVKDDLLAGREPRPQAGGGLCEAAARTRSRHFSDSSRKTRGTPLGRPIFQGSHNV